MGKLISRRALPVYPILVACVAQGVWVSASAAQPFVAQDDIVVGWSRSSASDTIRLYDASGQEKPDSWLDFAFVQSVSWDNLDGIPHNPMGNLIGGNFGTTAAGGSIYVYESGNGWSGVEVLGAGPTAHHTFASLGLLTTRLGGVSVSPDNTMIAFTGNDSSHIYILEYDAANRTITSGRQTTFFPLPLVGGVTSGTVWLNNETLLAASASGNLVAVNPATMSWMTVATVPGANLGNSQFTSLAYSPTISDYIYFSYSNHDSTTAVTTNLLHAIDPTNWQVVKTIDLGVSANTMREIALDSHGNLFFTTHGGIIQRIPDVRVPANMTDNSSVAIGGYGSSVPFSGIDVAHGEGGKPACYANCDQSTVPPILNVDDFTCFINRFAEGSQLPHAQQVMHYANCDNSTTAPALNVDDFTCFINAFAAGCR